MATIHKTDIDLDKNQLKNAVLENTTFTPSSPVVGQIIYNTTLNEPLVWNGSVWKSLFVSSMVESVTGVSGVPVNNTDPRNPIIGLQDRLPITDTRTTNEDPQWYFDNFPYTATKEFKHKNYIGLTSIFTGDFCTVETITQWEDDSGGYPFQIATNPADGKMAKRYGLDDTTWSNWEVIDAPIDRLPLILGRETIDDLPSYYQDTYPDSMVQEKKNVSTVGATSLIPSGSSLSVVTYIGTSTAAVYQVATSAASNRQIKRQGNITSNVWGPWEELITGKENTSNKVNNLNSPNTWEYPTTAAVQNAINSIPDDGPMTITPITYIDLMSLKTGKSLVPGTRYFISDRDIWIDALDKDKLAMECKRHFRIVKDEYYTPHTVATIFGNDEYLGIYGQTYNRGSTPNSGAGTFGTTYYAIWGGRMWLRNTSGADVPGTSNVTIAGGWTMINTTNDTYYESKIFDIKYNFDDDIIWEQADDRGNKIKRLVNVTTYIDITDWGNANIYNNENFGIYNNFRGSTKAQIYSNSNKGYIGNNSNNGIIYNNSNKGHILDNANNGNINSNSNNGVIQSNSNNGHILNNSNNGNIFGNSSSGSTTFNIRNNMNNGYIQYNNSTSNIDIQNNINNGRIGSTSITNRSSTIQDTQAHK